MVALFYDGANLAHYLPNTYKSYAIEYSYKSFLTNTELKSIFALTNAEKISLTNETHFHLTSDLSEQISNLSNMENLQQLTIDLAEPSDLTLQLTPFLLTAPALKNAVFHLPYSMISGKRATFARNQIIPSGWFLDTDTNHHWLSFKKKVGMNWWWEFWIFVEWCHDFLK